MCFNSAQLSQTNNAGYNSPSGFVDSEDSSGQIKPGEWRSIVATGEALVQLRRTHDTRYPESAKTIRDALKDYLNNEQGVVAWQLKHV